MMATEELVVTSIQIPFKKLDKFSGLIISKKINEDKKLNIIKSFAETGDTVTEQMEHNLYNLCLVLLLKDSLK